MTQKAAACEKQLWKKFLINSSLAIKNLPIERFPYLPEKKENSALCLLTRLSKNSLTKIDQEKHSSILILNPLWFFEEGFYIILHIKQANTQEIKEATREIIIGAVSFFVFAPAKYTAAI